MTKRRLPLGFRFVGFAAMLPTLTVATVVALLAGPALAASGSWSATSSGTWSDAANWDGGTIADGAGFTATFASDITSNVTVTLDSNRTLNKVVFGDANPATAGTWNIASLQAAAEFERLILTPAPANSTGTATITVNGNATATMTAPLEVPNNGGVFVKNGTGTLILSNTRDNTDPNRNRIGGKTAIMAGTVQIASDFSLGPPPGSYAPDHLSISNGGTLRTNSAVTLGNNRGVTIGVGGGTLSVNGGLLTYAGRFSGVGETLTTTGAGGISLRNSSGSPTEVNWDFTGAASRIFFRNTNGLGVGSVRVRNAVRLVREISTADVVNNSITIDSGGGLTARSGAGTFANVVFPATGSVLLNVDDARTYGLTVSSNNTLTGGLTINTSQGGTNPVGDVILTGVYSGTGGLVKTGTGASGRVILAGANTYSGSTTVATGTLLVNGNQSAATGPVLVATGATLSGTGTVGGATTITTGATLSPGASPGTLSFTQGVTLAAGSQYNWQMLSATGTAGAADAWDLLSVGGSLAIDATAADPLRLNLWTLSSTAPDVSGPAANFDPALTYAWTIASAAGGVTGFAADKFVIETAAANGTGGFANTLGTGTFSVNLVGNDLQLVFAPAGPTDVIVIDVPSGTKTQSEAGYPAIPVATSVTKIGAGTVVFDATNTYAGPTTVSAGTLEVAAADAVSGSAVTVASGATLAVGSGVTMKAPSVTVSGGTIAGGTLAVNTATGIGTLTINSGTIASTSSLVVGAGGLVDLPDASRLSLGVAGLAVTETGGGGKVDLGAGELAIAAGGISAADLRADIIAGLNGGNWDGTTGITSATVAASGGTRAVGYAVAGDGSARVSFAAPGDTNLDGQVDLVDLLDILGSGTYQQPVAAVWNQGDFNYDGVTDLLDLLAILGSGTYDQGTYFPAAPAAASIASVPEPGTWALASAAVAAALAVARRRRA